MLKWFVLREKLMKFMFKKEVQEYEETIELLHECLGSVLAREMELGKDLSEQIEFNKLWEEEVINRERELRLMNLIVEAISLGGCNEE